MKRPTQTDVAKAANVSRATVSYVLNNTLSVTISPETRQRVLGVIEQLGYEPDTRAQSLRSGDSRTVGLLIPDIHNPHYWQAVEGVEEEARKAGYDLLLAHSSTDQAREDYCLQALSRRTISGLIIIKAFDTLRPKNVEQLLASKRPVAEMGMPSHAFDCVFADYYQGARDVTEHLLSLGHRRFAFINGVAGPSVGVDRLHAYRQVLKEAGIPEAYAQVKTCGITLEDGYRAARSILAEATRPTALIVINDLLAIGVVRAAHDLNLRIPDDLSVASFDDLPVSAYLTPRLTTVRRDVKAEGRAVTKLLLERFASPNLPPRIVDMPANLVVRESTGPAPEHPS